MNTRCGSHVEVQSTDLTRICERALENILQLRDRRIAIAHETFEPLIAAYFAAPWYKRIFMRHPEKSTYGGDNDGAAREMRRNVHWANSRHDELERDFKSFIVAAQFSETVFLTVEDINRLNEWSTVND